MELGRFQVFLINLDPTIGHEIQKTRPCVIVSPDEMNHAIATVIIAPMTTKIRPYPPRVSTYFDGKNCSIVLDQLRTVDKTRLVKKLGKLDTSTEADVITVLQEIFAK